MSDRAERHQITDAQAALIDQRLEQFGAFMQDVFRYPELVSDIPDGATLAFHDMTILPDQRPLRLTAYRLPETTHWSVILAGGDMPHGKYPWQVSPHAFMWVVQPLLHRATWESPDEAFAAIETALQRAGEARLLAG